MLHCMLQATASLLIQVAVDQEEAEYVRSVVSKEEAAVKGKAAQTQALADDAKADLDQALPALNAALDSLNALNKGDIVEIKSMLKPPPLVQMTMEVRFGLPFAHVLVMTAVDGHLDCMQSVSDCRIVSFFALLQAPRA